MIGALVAGITGSGGASLSSYESIATSTLGSAASTITLSSIPSTFKHLQLRFSLDVVTTNSEIRLRINGDTSTNYARHNLWGNGTSANASGIATGTSNFISLISASDSTYPTVGIIDILDYTSTTRNKTVRALSGVDRNGSGEIWLTSGFLLSTAAIASLAFSLDSGNLDTGSTVALYGIKEA
jgi:hypothetical protein